MYQVFQSMGQLSANYMSRLLFDLNLHSNRFCTVVVIISSPSAAFFNELLDWTTVLKISVLSITKFKHNTAMKLGKAALT